jgi:hypothetical protein
MNRAGQMAQLRRQRKLLPEKIECYLNAFREGSFSSPKYGCVPWQKINRKLVGQVSSSL